MAYHVNLNGVIWEGSRLRLARLIHQNNRAQQQELHGIEAGEYQTDRKLAPPYSWKEHNQLRARLTRLTTFQLLKSWFTIFCRTVCSVWAPTAKILANTMQSRPQTGVWLVFFMTFIRTDHDYLVLMKFNLNAEYWKLHIDFHWHFSNEIVLCYRSSNYYWHQLSLY